METDTWRVLLIGGLTLNATLGLGYRVYRLNRGGPRSDVIGQAILGALLLGLAIALTVGSGWPRWGAFAYAALFGIVVMPVWVLAVLIPQRPRAPDYAFTAVYWIVLALIAVSALAM